LTLNGRSPLRTHAKVGLVVFQCIDPCQQRADQRIPVLFIVVAIAGLVFGEDAARGAIASQLSELMGRASADLVQTALESASGKSSGILASIVGAITLLITASGVFGEPLVSVADWYPSVGWKVEAG